MDKLTNKRFETFDYLSRYTGVPYYYDTQKKKDVYGLSRKVDFSTPYLSHKLVPEDTLDSLALDYYNNPTFWWIIASFNKILDPFENLMLNFTVIKIPDITSFQFE